LFSATGSDEDRSTSAGELLAFGASLGENIGAACADLVLANEIDFGRGSADIIGREHEPMIERFAARLGREVEVGGVNDADVLGRRRLRHRGRALDQSGSDQNADSAILKPWVMVASLFSGPVFPARPFN
jgi:hypothetical protein